LYIPVAAFHKFETKIDVHLLLHDNKEKRDLCTWPL